MANHKEAKLAERFSVYCDPRLKALAEQAADAAELPLSEFTARVLAQHLGRPELGKVPRKSIGRPRKSKQFAAAS